MNLRTVLALGIARHRYGCRRGSAHQPKPPATVGDLTKRTIEIHTDAVVSGGPAKAMASYQRFLQLQNADPKLRAEALRRLGDLNLEAGELERMTNEVTQLDLPGAEAIKLYTTLLQGYPDYARNDQVLYQLARAYETTGQRDLALATLDQIVRRYPKTREIAEVQFRRGELLFSAKRYADAEAAYQQVMARGPSGSTFYEQSLYKHGWSQFKQSQYDVCLQSFMKLLDRILVDRKTGTARKIESLTRANRELTDDTLRVVSISFTYLDGAASLDKMLSEHGPTPYAWMLYSRLGDLYVQKERFQDAANTYRAFVAREPTNEHAPVLSNQAIDAYSKGGFADLVVEGKAEYVRTYGFKAPFWKDREKSASPEVVAELKANLKDLAQYYHATAQKTKRLEDYTIAADWYHNLLSTFPNDPDASETNYLLADALFESHQYSEAATEYERTAYNYPPGTALGSGRLRGVGGVAEAGRAIAARGACRYAHALRRSRSPLCAGLSQPPGECRRADARGAGCVCRARSAPLNPAQSNRCWRAIPRWRSRSNALPGPSSVRHISSRAPSIRPSPHFNTPCSWRRRATLSTPI